MDLHKMLNDSDSPLETICSSIVDAVVIADANKKFVYWNDSARQLLATGPLQVDPEIWAREFKLYYVDTDELVRFDDLPMIMALRGEIYSDYKVMTKNENFPDGIILSVNGKPILEKGMIVGALTTFRNVTAQVRLEEQIKKDRAFYRSILDLMPSMVCIKDLDGRYLYGNKSFLRLLNTQNISGRTLMDFLPEEAVLMIKSHEKIVLETEKVHEFEEIVDWGDLKVVYHSTRFPYRDSQGNIIGLCGVLKDVTKEIDAKLLIEQERNKTAHISKLAAIGILAAEIAHEIKNPLTIMRTNNDVIRYALREPEIDKHFLNAKMYTQDATIERIDRVASSLSMLSKDTSKELPEKFKLQDLLDDIKALTSYRTRKMNLNIELINSNCTEIEMYANRVQISEVLLNLVMNALDAIEEVQKPKIWITCHNEDQNIMIRVYDNGSGVSDVIEEKIFEPFFTTKDISKGTGLGLSISKKIVTQHGGDLYYDKDDRGHCFVIQLPLVKRNGEKNTL